MPGLLRKLVARAPITFARRLLTDSTLGLDPEERRLLKHAQIDRRRSVYGDRFAEWRSYWRVPLPNALWFFVRRGWPFSPRLRSSLMDRFDGRTDRARLFDAYSESSMHYSAMLMLSMHRVHASRAVDRAFPRGYRECHASGRKRGTRLRLRRRRDRGRVVKPQAGVRQAQVCRATFAAPGHTRAGHGNASRFAERPLLSSHCDRDTGARAGSACRPAADDRESDSARAAVFVHGSGFRTRSGRRPSQRSDTFGANRGLPCVLEGKLRAQRRPRRPPVAFSEDLVTPLGRRQGGAEGSAQVAGSACPDGCAWTAARHRHDMPVCGRAASPGGSRRGDGRRMGRRR